MATHTAMAQGSDALMRSSFEQRIGILHYTSERAHTWHGQIRTRFTDFQVHEISKEGDVIHLDDLQAIAKELTKGEPPVQLATKPLVNESSQSKTNGAAANGVDVAAINTPDSQLTTTISLLDRTFLTDLVGKNTAGELIDLHSKAIGDKKAQPRNLGTVKIGAISDKAQRSRVHLEIRRIFDGKFDTTTEADGSIKATVAGRGNQGRGTRSRNERSRNDRQNANQGDDGKFLHFTLYKENRDTIEAISQIARLLNLKPSFFGTAGTKDRRAVTTQRVSMRRRNPQTLVFLNDRIHGVKIGDFKFEKYPICLGQHSGNEFVIVLKNCHFGGTEGLSFEKKLSFAKSAVESALEQVIEKGFINYYGTQRFGTHQIGTQEVGMMILKQDFEGAVRALLSFDPNLLDTSDPSSLAPMRRDDASRARACSIFLDRGDAQHALGYLPKRCHVESALIRHLSRQPKDFVGALLSISRGMRTMYVHAYQSLVWNFAASKRWECFGPQVVRGDLVLSESETYISTGDIQNENDDEETIHLAERESLCDDTPGLRAHVLTDEEASSGKYSIFDIVLPSPGWDVVYPDNEIGQFYAEFMAREENGGLDPQDMLRRQRDFSLPGTYRKLMGKFIGTPSATVQAYSNDTDQLVPTDLDLIRSRKAREAVERVAAQQKTESPMSAWQEFAANPEKHDRQEYQARVEKQKAEEASNRRETRLKDTWVQTSLDENHKRVKVSRHVDDIKMENDVENNIENEIQADNEGSKQKEIDIDEDMADQSNAVKSPTSAWQEFAANPEKYDLQEYQARAERRKAEEVSKPSEIRIRDTWVQTSLDGSHKRIKVSRHVDELTMENSVKNEVQADNEVARQKESNVDEDMIDQPNAATPPETRSEEPTSNLTTGETGNNNLKSESGQLMDGVSYTPSAPRPHNHASEGESAVGKAEQPADAATNRHSAAQARRLSPPATTTDKKKMAVILRFSLNTSQYATIVLRELQGRPL